MKFGKLYEQVNFEQAALTFVTEYGLPGDREQPVKGEREIRPAPTKMKLSEFRDEARRACAILTFYEAVLNGDAPAVKNLFLELRDDRIFALWDRIFRFERIEGQDEVLLGSRPNLCRTDGRRSGPRNVPESDTVLYGKR